jgi:hypothetical protein
MERAIRTLDHEAAAVAGGKLVIPCDQGGTPQGG